MRAHKSDCAVHNAPAQPKGACDCGAGATHCTMHDTFSENCGHCWKAEAEALRALIPTVTEGFERMVFFSPSCGVTVGALMEGRGPLVRKNFDEWVERVKAVRA